MRLSPSITILRTQSDERLVVLARGGSEAAFAAIVERYRRPLQRACRRVLPESRAEDAVQQVFMSAWMALERGDEVANLRGWLLMIARNTSLNALRSPGFEYHELRDSLAGSAAPQEDLERREVMRQTLAGLAALPERQREALLRSAVEGVAYADIAHDLGLSEGAARQLVLRARTTMRAAATAVVPLPLLQSLALPGARTDATLRIAELAAAGSGAGGTMLLAKAGVVAVMAGGVAVGPAIVQREDGAAKASKVASAAEQRAPASAVAVSSSPRAFGVAAAAQRTSAVRPIGEDARDSRGPAVREREDRGRRDEREDREDRDEDDEERDEDHEERDEDDDEDRDEDDDDERGGPGPGGADDAADGDEHGDGGTAGATTVTTSQPAPPAGGSGVPGAAAPATPDDDGEPDLPRLDEPDE